MDELKNIINKQKYPYPQYRIEISTCIAATLHILNGIAWSITLSDWQYLDKSGSIVVIIGILLAWRDVTGRINWFKKYAKSEIDSKIIESKKNSKGMINGEIQKNIQEELNSINIDIQKCLSTLKNRIRTIEAIILITGTFVWGYGSVIANHIHNFA